jgi:hypothetical protein
MSDEAKIRFANLAFQSEPEVLDHFKNFIFSNPIIKSLMYVPVNCAIIAQVYKDIVKFRNFIPKTMTELYSTLILVLIRRYMIETKKWNDHSKTPSDLKGLPEGLSILLKGVSELAYRGLFKEDVQLVFTDGDIEEGFCHLGLLNEAKEMYVCEGVKTTYSFLHLSIQEFLAAWHVSCYPDLVDEAVSKINFSKSGSTISGQHQVFGEFLAGMVGCTNFPTEVEPSRYLFLCLYEAQNPGDIKRLLKSTSPVQVALINSLDMYAFGYTLINAPIQWKVACHTSLSVLASSLATHCGEVLGSIIELDVDEVDDNSLLTLPKHVLHSVVALKLRANIYISKLISVLPSLQSISLNMLQYRGPQDFILYRALKKISQLRALSLIFGRNITLKGIQEIASLITNSTTLEAVEVQHFLTKYCLDNLTCELHGLITAALSSPAVKSLSTDIPFEIMDFSISRNMEHVKFTFSPQFAHSSYFLAIANLCRMPSMKSLEICSMVVTCKPPTNHRPVYSDFLAALNDSLWCNPSIDRLALNWTGPFTVLTDGNTLFRAFQKNLNIPQRNLRKSKSLMELMTWGTYAGDEVMAVTPWNLSCSSVFEVKFLRCDVHPILRKALQICHRVDLDH